MPRNRKVAQVGALCRLFDYKPEEITKHSGSVYQWSNVLYEVVGRRTKTAPDSHYISYKYGIQTWYIRELGTKSKIYKEIMK